MLHYRPAHVPETGDPTGCRSRSSAVKELDSSQRKLWGHWSGRWESNPRPSAWQAEALPLSYIRMEEAVGFEPTVPLRVRWFSRPDHSTTLTRFQILVRLTGLEPVTSPLSGVCSTI